MPARAGPGIGPSLVRDPCRPHLALPVRDSLNDGLRLRVPRRDRVGEARDLLVQLAEFGFEHATLTIHSTIVGGEPGVRRTGGATRRRREGRDHRDLLVRTTPVRTLPLPASS